VLDHKSDERVHTTARTKPKLKVKAETCDSCLRGLPSRKGKSKTCPFDCIEALLHTDHLSNMFAQCDGNRPSCRRCIRREIPCEYDVEAGMSRSLSLRRKNDTLQGEVNQLRELLSQVHPMPEAGTLITPRYPPGPTESLEPTIENESGDASLQQNVLQRRDNGLLSALESLDFSALSISNLKLQAQPWTAVAGDGLVSELISSFFAYDNCFYLPFIDRECFLHDMQAGDTNKADFCSPLLVNAICALRCVSIR
jgi:hypothetical protein